MISVCPLWGPSVIFDLTGSGFHNSVTLWGLIIHQNVKFQHSRLLCGELLMIQKIPAFVFFEEGGHLPTHASIEGAGTELHKSGEDI